MERGKKGAYRFVPAGWALACSGSPGGLGREERGGKKKARAFSIFPAEKQQGPQKQKEEKKKTGEIYLKNIFLDPLP